MAISMNPAPIYRAADDITQVATTAKDRIASLLHSSREAAAGNPGWRSSAVLHELRQAWEQRVATLVKGTENAAQSLRDSANTVSASDREAADRMLRVLQGMAEEQ